MKKKIFFSCIQQSNFQSFFIIKHSILHSVYNTTFKYLTNCQYWFFYKIFLVTKHETFLNFKFQNDYEHLQNMSSNLHERSMNVLLGLIWMSLCVRSQKTFFLKIIESWASLVKYTCGTCGRNYLPCTIFC